MSVFLIMRSFHVEKSWQDVNENPSHPGCHCVRLWCPEMDIKDNYCYTYADKICKLDPFKINKFYLNVSRIIVKSTNFPRRGTTNEVGGMISASSRKNTVRERRMLIERLTYERNKLYRSPFFSLP